MKKHVVAAAVVMAMSAGSAFAAGNSLQRGAMALNVGVDDTMTVGGKYFLADRVALLADVGFSMGSGDTSDSTDFALRAGGRYYLRSADVAPFAGGFLAYSSFLDGDVTRLSIAGEFGAEYFMAPQFSVEGSAQIGVSIESVNDSDDVYFLTNTAGLSINYYF